MERSRQIIRVSVIGILANLMLVGFKAAVGLITGSIAVMLDAVNNLSDALSSVITIVGMKLAGKPPDKKHPYGYGRIENISSVTIAVIVLLAGLTSFRESFSKALHPEAASYSVASLIIIAAGVLVKFFLGRYVKAQGVKYNSESLVASGSDAAFDALISLTTLVAAGVSLIWGLSIEGILGVLISVVILKAGLEILMESLGGIIGSRVDSELSSRLKEQVGSYEGVLGAYDLVLHRYGPEKTIGSVHIEVDDGMTARQIHRLTRQISEDIHRDFGIVLTVGIYASNTSGDENGAIRQRVHEITAEYPEVLQIHGFYVDVEKMRVSFDLVIAFGSDMGKICGEIAGRAHREFPDYSFDVVLDSDYSD